MKKVLQKLRNYGLVILATASFANYTSAQFGCGSGVVLADGYTASGITTPGIGGIEDWNTNPTGTSILGSYWDDDVYLYEYTAGATAEEISMTVFSRKTWTGIGIFSTCTGTTFGGELDAVGNSSASSIASTVTALISAGQTVYIAIGQYGTPNDLDFDVTSFTVTSVTCPDPSALSATNITAFTADLGWTEIGSATSWNVEYGASGFTPGAGTMVAATANPYTLTGLSADTDYEFYVQADCGGGDLSSFVGPFSFTTTPTCPAPTALTTSNTTTTSADLSWTENGTATLYNLEYGAPGFTTGNGTTVTGVANPYSLTGLTSDTQYEFYVQADCGGGDLSAWEGPFAFSTLCNAATIPFSQDFEAVTTPNIPNCGSLENTGIGNDWKTSSFATGFTGNALNYSYHSASNPGNANSWYFTQGVQLVAGVSYDVSYKYGNNSTFYTESMKVEFGTAANEAGMTTQLADYPAMQESAPVDAMHTFVAPTTGVYYIGFNSYSIENQNQIYVDDISIVETPACPDVTALTVSNLTSTSLDLGWTENGTATVWNIEYGVAGYTFGTGTPITATTTNPNPITGLSPNTAYDFYVQADCGSGSVSNWSPVFTVSTTCVAFTVPYNEGFETGYTHNTDVAGCITQETENGTQLWTANNTLTTYNRSPRTGAWNAFLRYGNTDWMFIPVDLVAGTSYTMDVYARQDGATATNADLSLSYGTANNAAAMTNVIAAPVGLVDGAYQLVSGSFTPATSGVYYMGIKGYISGSPWYISLDDIAVYATPTCVFPTALTASNVLSTSADLGWTSTASEFQVEYDVTGFTLGSGTMVTTTSNPESISGLTADTDYSFYVRAICSPGDTSTWAGPFSFYTGVCTPAPTLVDGDGITNVTMGTINNTTTTEPNNYGDYTAQVTDVAAGATLPIDITLETGYTYNLWAWVDWNGDLDFDDANEEYYLGESTSANPTTFNASIVVPAGVALGNYRIRIGGADSGLGSTSPSDPCYTGSYAAFEDYTLNVIAAPLCADPSALGVSNLTTTSADLDWTENGTATTWNIEYGPAGFTPGAGTAIVGVTTNPFTLTALMPCTNYEYYVQSDCGGGDLSAFVGPLAFTTLAAPATGTDTQVACDSYTWIDGVTYTASNNTATYTIVGGGSSACGNDSIVTLDLTINTAVTGTDVQVACETFDWIDGNTYTSDNNTATFTVVGGAANGCDSIVTLDLTIEQGSDAGADNADTKCLNEPVDLASYLSAGADTGGTYYGPGGSPLSSSMITVSNQAGAYVYSYVVGGSGVCDADTALFTITADGACDYLAVDSEIMVDISVYPNPATSVLTILNPSNTSSLKVEMLDMNGKVVLVENKALNNATKATLAIENLERGIYTLRIYNNEGQKTFKIVKQ